MISDMFISFAASFVVDPMQVEIAEKVQAAGQPVAIVQQAQACIASQGPELFARASRDWGWAATTAVSVLVGFTPPEDLLDSSDPACSDLTQALDDSVEVP